MPRNAEPSQRIALLRAVALCADRGDEVIIRDVTHESARPRTRQIHLRIEMDQDAFWGAVNRLERQGLASSRLFERYGASSLSAEVAHDRDVHVAHALTAYLEMGYPRTITLEPPQGSYDRGPRETFERDLHVRLLALPIDSLLAEVPILEEMLPPE